MFGEINAQHIRGAEVEHPEQLDEVGLKRVFSCRSTKQWWKRFYSDVTARDVLVSKRLVHEQGAKRDDIKSAIWKYFFGLGLVRWRQPTKRWEHEV
eukprot:4203924-Amphidinium_carterae.1